jgi:glucose/arabinose dehydrogenase
MKKYILLMTLFISLLGAEYKLEKLASGLGIPWGMVFLDDDKLLFTQRDGKAGVLSTTTKKITMLKGVPKVLARGQGGLLDVVLSPDFKSSGWIYFTYVKNVDSKGATTLARAKLFQDHLMALEDLLVTKSITSTYKHYGSRITFDENGHLFFSVGDRGVRPHAQDTSNHAGSIIRLNLDGSVPRDNPFTNHPNTKDEIYSYGHRNPQGMYYDRKHKRLWSIEHGPRGGDEINLVLKGKNYGWPVISYGKEYWGPVSVGEGTHKEGMMQPKKVYTPSIAPSSLMLYEGDLFPKWKGRLFSGALVLRHINIIEVGKDGELLSEERIVKELDERIRCITQDRKGYIYFSTDSGEIYRLYPD